VTRRTAFIGLMLLLTAGAGQAQTPEPAAGASPATQPAPAGQKAPDAESQKPDALEPRGCTYNPEGRRDPFVSLLRRGTDQPRTGTHAGGLAGLDTSEVSLRGTLRSQGAFVGIVQGVDGRNYIVRAGDKLADGTIRSIGADAMVILQQVNDPLSLEKEREVRKLLRQTEEAK